MKSAYLEIAFPIPLNRTFHYAAPGGSAEGDPAGRVGCRVLAPFGKNIQTGYVVGFTREKPPFAIKPVNRFLDPDPLLGPVQMDLARWISNRYLSSLGEALAAVLPSQLAPPKRIARPAASDSPAPPAGRAPETIRLSAAQKAHLSSLERAVEKGAEKPFLLRGVTHSGKTEMYLRAIDRALALNKQALFLLPEIALTPPFIDHLRSRYGPDRTGLWHSGLSAGERYRTWMAAKQGELHVMLGARSAVFTPFPNLGILILDEEHEPSYKQEDRPRYHTREVALERARAEGAVLVMGSATPSLESYQRARSGEFELMELTSRVEDRELPPVTVVDRRPLNAETATDEKSPAKRKRRNDRSGYAAVFTEPLKLAMENRLAKREQILLFVNRRGFTPFLRCSKCGWVARCARCSMTLAMHLRDEHASGLVKTTKGIRPVPAAAALQCHSCLKSEPVPIQCPSCRGMRLHPYGIGTQRVEEEIRELFPFVKMARLDRDAAGSRSTYERIYREFASGRLDMIVGTQMIAKGFDFPNVTLVGVVDADVSLHLPDFRAAERTFQLLTQVSGRTGRGAKGGEVIVQTHHPDHYAIQSAQTHDFPGFFQKEIPFREGLRYPPFTRLALVELKSSKEPAALAAAEAAAEKIDSLRTGCQVLGPAPAPYTKVRGQFRFHVVLKGNDEALERACAFLRGHRPKKAFMIVDVDPQDLL